MFIVYGTSLGALQGFFSKFLMGGTQNFRSPSVPDGDEVLDGGGGGDLQKKFN